VAVVGGQRRRQRVVELAVARGQPLIAFQHNVNEVVGGFLAEQLRGAGRRDRARRVGWHEGSGVGVDDAFQLRHRQIPEARDQHPQADDQYGISATAIPPQAHPSKIGRPASPRVVPKFGLDLLPGAEARPDRGMMCPGGGLLYY
jgi:hypothetical protein